jgi:hypothetical protein
MGLLAAVLLSIDPLLEAQRAKAARLAERRPTASELEALLHRLGLDAEPLAAAGVEPDHVDGIVRRLVEALAEEDRSVGSIDWRYADAGIRLAQAERDEAARRNLQERNAAEQRLAARTRQRDELMDRLFKQAKRPLSAAQRATLMAIRGNRQWNLPVEFLVVERTEEQWLELRDALSAERQCRERGEILEVETHALLARIRHAPAVGEARANLERLGESANQAVQAALMKHGKEE